VLGSSCLDQTLDNSDIGRLKDHFEVKDLTLGHPMSFDFRILLDLPCLDPLPSLLEMSYFIYFIQITLDGLYIHIVTSLLSHWHVRLILHIYISLLIRLRTSISLREP